MVGGAGISGDAVIGGGNIRIDAPITGSARIGGGTVYLNAPIQGNVTVQANTLTLGPSAVISGDLTYTASKELAKEEGAVVNGKISFEPRAGRNAPTAAGIAALVSIGLFVKFLALFVCALVVGLIFKRYGREIVSKATIRPLLEIGRGLIVLVVLPVISVLLLVTVIGIPFGILGLLGLVIMLIFSWIAAPIIVGSIAYRYIARKDDVSWKTILLGAFICTFLGIVPFIGWLAQALIMLLTLGSIVAMKLEIARQWK
jgi:hypothetical protein